MTVKDLREPGCACCADADCAAGRHCDGFALNGNCCGCGLKTARYWLTWPWNALEDAAMRLWWRVEDRLGRALSHLTLSRSGVRPWQTSGMQYDWNRYQRPAVARFNWFISWYLTVMAAVFWPLFLWFAITRDWTVVIVPPLVTAGAVVHRLTMRRRYGVRRVPDYAAIARMEREIWGRTFRHER